MKKTIITVLTIMLIAVLPIISIAAPSPESSGIVSAIENAVDSNGNTISATIKEADVQVSNSIKDTEALKKVIGESYNTNMSVLDVKQVTVPENAVFPATLTFDVDPSVGVTESTKGTVLHFNGEVWEEIQSTFGSNKITATFDSLSPVAFVIDMSTVESFNADAVQTSDMPRSPQTSDNIVLWIAISAVFMTIIFAGKKMRGISK